MGCGVLAAQELKLQPTPFTAWLDFQRLGQGRSLEQRSLPIWLEKVETHTARTLFGHGRETTYRLRFRQFSGVNDELMMRVVFEDTQRPAVAAWNEIGARILDPVTLGSGLGLPTAETMLLPMAGVSYLEIVVPGDGSNIRGVLLSSVQSAQIRRAVDFAAPSELSDPFGNNPGDLPAADDSLLFGRVKATLDARTTLLSPRNGGSETWEFSLATQPQLAVLTFEILGADLSDPPQVAAGERALGPAALMIPDLADPAIEGRARPASADLSFRYHGWLKCQKVVPGSALSAGVNRIHIHTPGASLGTTVAIRNVGVQLKYTHDSPAD